MLATAVALTGIGLGAAPGLAAADPDAAGSGTERQVAQATGVMTFDIPSQPLAEAIAALGRQTGLQISAGADVVDGRMAQPVNGTMTPAQALDRMLAGTGVIYRLDSAGTAFLEAAPRDGADGAVELDPLLVQSVALDAKATVGAPPPAYAGGQVARGARLGALGNADIMDVPFSMTAFTEDLMANQQAETIADVLANDPAVRTSYGYGNFAEEFVIRGFPLYGDDLSVDGLYGLAPRQIASTEMFERVEVVRGATAFLNGVAPGNSGIGGSINLVPKRAGDDPLTRLDLSYGSTTRFGGHADVSRRFGPDKAFGVRLNVAGRDGEGAIEDEDRSMVLGALAADYRGERLRAAVDISSQYLTIDQGRPVVFLTGQTVPDAPDASTNYGQPWTYANAHDTTAQGRVEYDLFPSLMAYMAAGIRDMREEGAYASPYVGDDGTGTASRLTVFREDFTSSGQIGLRGDLITGPVHHRVDVGGSTLDTENRNAWTMGSSQAVDIYTFSAVSDPATLYSAGDMDDLPLVSESTLRSAFGSDTLSILDDRVMLTLGLRYQWIDTTSYDTATGAVTSAYKEKALSPVIGLVVKPIEEVSLYASRIEGLAQGPTAPSTAVNSGEIFAPYKSVQYEVGVKVDMGTVGGSLAFYQTSQPQGMTDPATMVYDVSGEQRNRGIEAMVFGEPMKGLRVLAGATITDATLQDTAGGVDDGNTAAGVPDYQVNVGAEWAPWFAPDLVLSGRVLHTGAQYVNSANTLQLDSWTRLDLGARYATKVYGTPMVIRGNIENVTNASYWASANGGYLTQGAPLTAKLSIGMDF